MPGRRRHRRSGSCAAEAKQAVDPRNTIVSVKRFMGRGLKDVAHIEAMPYDFEDSPGMVRLRTVAGGQEPGGGFRRDPAPPARARRGQPGRRLGWRGDHGAGLFRRCPAPGHQGRRAPGRGSTCCVCSTNRPPPRWPTASTTRPRASTRCTTSAAAPSTSPSCALARRFRGAVDQRRRRARRRRLRSPPVLLDPRSRQDLATLAGRRAPLQMKAREAKELLSELRRGAGHTCAWPRARRSTSW
jgi:hypothetical protein